MVSGSKEQTRIAHLRNSALLSRRCDSIRVVCGRLIRHAHCVGGSNFHLQFTPAFRRKVFLEPRIRDVCRREIKAKAEQLGLASFAVEFGPNHMHAFVGNCRKYDVSKIVHGLKGYTSFVIRRECAEELKEYHWGDKFWSEGYFYEGVGNVTSSAIKFYIERQQGKHWTEQELGALKHREDPAQRTLGDFN